MLNRVQLVPQRTEPSRVLLLLFVHLSLVIYPLPIRVPLIGPWVHVHARV
jgi:hypothetical protein